MENRKIGVAILGVLLLVVVVGGQPEWQRRLGFGGGEETAQTINPVGEQIKLTIGKADLRVEVRRDDQGRSLGLSYRESLKENEGMVFVFPQKDQPTFWMKDMKFPLDMIWLDGGKVVEITAAIPAPTVEKPRISTVAPNQPVDGVIEVNSGWAERNGVKVGDAVNY